MVKRMTTTVSSKRQITLPAELCREMGIQPGQKLDVKKLGPMILIRRAEMSKEEFDELLEAANMPGAYSIGVNEYIRRIREGDDLDAP